MGNDISKSYSSNKGSDDMQKSNCNNNQISNFYHLPSSLQELNCCGNKITNVDHLPASLQILNCNNNLLINKFNRLDLYIKRSNYLRYLRNISYTRKTQAWMILHEIRNTSQFYENCLPNDIIKHIISFV